VSFVIVRTDSRTGNRSLYLESGEAELWSTLEEAQEVTAALEAALPPVYSVMRLVDLALTQGKP